MPYFPPAGGGVLLPNSIDASMLAANARVPLGQCKLVYVSATQIRLDRCNGCLLTIDNVPQVIPAAGVVMSNAGLGLSTVWYVYADMNVSAMRISVSANAAVADPRNGMKVHPTFPTMTLVGMVRTDGTGVFKDQTDQRYVRTWFSDPGVALVSGEIGGFATGSTSWTPMANLYALFWTNEPVVVAISGAIYASQAGYGGVGIGYEGATPSSGFAYISTWAAGQHHDASQGRSILLAEGFHQISAFMHSATMGTATVDTMLLSCSSAGNRG